MEIFVEQRISLITLGVNDVAVATAFYTALGWEQVDAQEGIVAFDLIGQTLGLYPIKAMADDIGVPVESLGHGAQTLGYNCRIKADVARTLNLAQTAGAQILKPASDVFWGGHHGYFADLDGHIWEIAFNPFSPLSKEGAFRWNGYEGA
jgi:catechol 2,3-dioxygenase-like lactoylglutathione lyase family enzyme